MKLPAVAIAASFSGGIALGLWCSALQRFPSPVALRTEALLALLVLTGAFLLLRFGKTAAAAGLSLNAWILLGVMGAGIAQQSLPANHVLSLVQSGQLDLRSPLRWHGVLRDEPTRLPWGWGYDIELTAVEYEGRALAIKGGLRVSYTPRPDDSPLPDLHAGDEIAVLTQAKQPKIYRDEGAFDRRAYLAQQGIDLVATLRASELIERTGRLPNSLAISIARIRRRLREEVDALFVSSPKETAILRAMLLGDRSFIDRAEATDFQKTGVFHVLVVAGLHVGAFAAFLFWAGRKLKLSVGWTALLTLVALFSYVAVIEQRPPVLRASLMAAIVILGGYFFRRLDLLNSIAVAAVILLVARPQELGDSSFQLSFLAVGCIAGLALPWLENTVQPYVKSLRGWRDVTRDTAHLPRASQFRMDLRAALKWCSSKLPERASKPAADVAVRGLAFLFRVWELIVLTVVLQLGMLPLLASDFHRVTLSGPVVNLFAVPLTGIIVPLGFLTLACGLVLPTLAKWISAPLGLLTATLLHGVQRFARFPRWSYRIPGPPEWLMLVFFLLALGLVVSLRLRAGSLLRRKLGLFTAGSLAAAAVVIALFPFAPKWSPGKLELTVLDVGQGDSLFVVSPKGHTLLIDGGGSLSYLSDQESHSGPDPGEDAVSPYLWSRGFKRLDVVALTHAHMDHIGGLFAILDNFHVGTLWISRNVRAPVLVRLEEEARSRGIPVVHELRGRPFSWDGVQTQFLWPESQSHGNLATPPQNNDSLVLHLRFGNRSLLLTGDAEKEAERQMLADNLRTSLQADVLKAGHHGSKNSTTSQFLAAVHPQVGVISAGEDNPYGQPNPELLQRLQDAHVRVLRTDWDGAVHVLTDGKSLQITCFVACPEMTNANALRQPQPPDHQQRGQQE
jgi:competence protein ComEC